MDLFSGMDEALKKKVVLAWAEMKENEKMHFINQVTLALIVLGNDANGKAIISSVLERLVNDGSKDLSDFGLYIGDNFAMKEAIVHAEKIKRASVIIDGYRIKNALPSEPHKDLQI